MKATEAKLLDFLKRSPQFVIPIYQRTYSWTEKECRQLWDDIVRTGSDEAISAHFVGSIVYVEQGLYQVSSPSPMLVIDGQQRLTTLTLLLAALARQLDKLDETSREPLDGFSPRKLRNYYLLNPEEEGERHYKLILSQTDKDSLLAIVSGHEQPQTHSLRIWENFKLFDSWLSARKGDLLAVCQGIAKLVVVDISLSRDQDNPQLIFESMNSTGRELSQADLIRNFILMGLPPTSQTRLYERFWRPMELDFGQDAYGTHFDGFVRHYLTLKTGEVASVGGVYEAFKAYARLPTTTQAGVEALVADIRTFSGYFCAMALGAESNSELRLAFQDLRELKVDVAYPFLLELYDDYSRGIFTPADFISAIRLIESYLFRRSICAIPSNSVYKIFATFARALKKDRYLESMQAHLLGLPSYRRFPTDDEFVRELQNRDLYNYRNRTYWLRRLENHGRKERVPVDEYTIEHIMPQNEDLATAWKRALGPEWERIHQTWLHTLGNLTLTGYNSEYSDRPFVEKRDRSGGFRESPLKLNKMLGKLEDWNEKSIRTRGEYLARWALEVWASPKLPREVLAKYREKPASSGDNIHHHPHLLNGKLRHVFEAFRAQVFDLDPCVTEEILKTYISYKAETNFVDLVPQAKRLRLSLNMSLSDVNDPKGLCRDVAGLGHWGKGDVEIDLVALSELPYVMGLVRQSYEQQMGSSDDD